MDDEADNASHRAEEIREFNEVEQTGEALEQPSESARHAADTPQNDAEIEERGVVEQLPDDRSGAAATAFGAAGGGGMFAGDSPAEREENEIGPVTGDQGT